MSTPEILAIILGSGALSSLTTFFLHRRTERITEEVRREFEKYQQAQVRDIEWKKESTKILGQIYLHLNRTITAFNRTYSKLSSYDAVFEQEVMYASNKHIRDIILTHGHFIPPSLITDATKLVEHYDAWLVKYQKLRINERNHKICQIYVGPDGFRFPEDSEEKFKAAYIKQFNELITST